MAAFHRQEYFPSDMAYEILSRVGSLKTLDACKSVCKEWKQLIYESSFMPLYCKRSNHLSGYFIQDIIKHKHLSMFVSVDQPDIEEGGRIIESIPSDMRILASCNQGILCCVRRRDKNYRYFVCKPATQQWQSLPNPKLRYKTAAVAITVLRSSPLRYKIVRLSKQGVTNSLEEYSYRCEVFDSDAWKWTEIQDALILPYSELIDESRPSVFASSSIHWLTSDDNVVQFDVDEQIIHKFPLPEAVHKNSTSSGSECKHLVEYEGRLGLSCLTDGGDDMELWVTENVYPINDHETMIKWRKKMVVNVKSLEENDQVKYPSPAAFYNSGIVLMKASQQVIFYKLQDCSFSKVKLYDKLRVAREIFQFRSDSERVDLKARLQLIT